MKKLKLSLEELRVESFATGAATRAEGTVHGHAPQTRNQNTCQATCAATCLFSCEGTCQYTCKCVFTEPVQTCGEPCIPPPID
jgi:hypothetical protein